MGKAETAMAQFASTPVDKINEELCLAFEALVDDICGRVVLPGHRFVQAANLSLALAYERLELHHKAVPRFLSLVEAMESVLPPHWPELLEWKCRAAAVLCRAAVKEEGAHRLHLMAKELFVSARDSAKISFGEAHPMISSLADGLEALDRTLANLPAAEE